MIGHGDPQFPSHWRGVHRGQETIGAPSSARRAVTAKLSNACGRFGLPLSFHSQDCPACYGGEARAKGTAQSDACRSDAGSQINMNTATAELDIDLLKSRIKSTWETGDFGQVARYNMPAAQEFMERLDVRSGMRVLDVACGTGNLAVLAARAGCEVCGLDIASNLIAQAQRRARAESLDIEFIEGDAESLPYPAASFDLVISMYGVMFAPRPRIVVEELLRVTRPGGLIALANWTPEGFIGKMFDVFKAHLPSAPPIPSPLEWGDAAIVRARLAGRVEELWLNRRLARLRFPFDPAGTVDFFRRYYGPTARMFATLNADAQRALRADLIQLQAAFNTSTDAEETDTLCEYLEIHARPGQQAPRWPA